MAYHFSCEKVIQMFLLAQEVQLLLEALEAHEDQGNQEHQRYQEPPTDSQRGSLNRRLVKIIKHPSAYGFKRHQ